MSVEKREASLNSFLRVGQMSKIMKTYERCGVGFFLCVLELAIICLIGLLMTIGYTGILKSFMTDRDLAIAISFWILATFASVSFYFGTRLMYIYIEKSKSKIVAGIICFCQLACAYFICRFYFYKNFDAKSAQVAVVSMFASLMFLITRCSLLFKEKEVLNSDSSGELTNELVQDK